MPNLLAHFGAQGIASRVAIPRADLRWILLGALLPDLAWILHRGLRVLPGLDPVDLRAYAIAQSSLALCCLLAGGLGLLSRSPAKVFAILASGSLLHLLLDATQTKWGNGVHLFAPFSWELWNAGWYWPESPPTVALTLLGAVWVAFAWWRAPGDPIGVRLPRSGARLAAAVALLLAWLALPVPLSAAVERADAHFVGTLRDPASRSGKPIAFDRVRYERSPSGGFVESWNGERLRVARGAPARSGVISLRGRFTDASTLEIERLHLHAGRARDYPSYVGLLLVLGVWLAPIGSTQLTGNSWRP